MAFGVDEVAAFSGYGIEGFEDVVGCVEGRGQTLFLLYTGWMGVIHEKKKYSLNSGFPDE